MSTILALDTSFTSTGAAILRDGFPVASATAAKARGHSENLVDLIDAVFTDAGLTKRDLTAIGVTVGPGSFTGLRVGIAFAKGLALALGVPMAGVSSLEALAHPHLRRGAAVAVAVDAKKEQVYSAAYDAEGKPLVSPGARGAAQFARELAALGLPVLLVGNGAAAYEKELTEPLGGLLAIAEREAWEIDPKVVALLAERELGEGRGVEPGALVPIYLRRSEAEEKFSPNP